MYRFLLSARWLGLGLLMTAAAAVMVGLGLWQLDRYHERSAINAHIDGAASRAPVPVAALLSPPPPGDQTVGPAPSAPAAWAQVTVTGRYDPAYQVLARARTQGGQVGYEVITPLVLADGSAVLVDRGFLAASRQAATHLPPVAPPPSGEVTVVGWVHAPESRADAPERLGAVLTVRRIAPAQLRSTVPYPLYGAYVTLASQAPPADPALATIAPQRQNAAMNAGYVVQWWMLSLLALAGFGYLVRRQARAGGQPDTRPDACDSARTASRVSASRASLSSR